MSKQAFKRMRRHVHLEVNRKPLDAYAWPGGYQLVYVMTDGGTLCPECVNAEIDQIDASTRQDAKDGWALAGVQADWEGPGWNCSQCDKHFDSEYGDPDGPKCAGCGEASCDCPSNVQSFGYAEGSDNGR